MTAQTECPAAEDLIRALEVALPYVQKVAATAPTEMNRQQRQRQAVRDVEMIREIIAKATA